MVDELLDRGRTLVEAGMGGQMMAPISVAVTISRRWPRCSGVSRGTITRRRRSLSVTSAARTRRLSLSEWAMPASVFMEQGMATMPSIL
jgi:hypothetical protein